MVYRAQNLNIKLFTSDKEALGIFMMCAPAFEIPLIVPLTFTIILCLKFKGFYHLLKRKSLANDQGKLTKKFLSLLYDFIFLNF